MRTLYFSVPYNNSPDLLKQILAVKNYKNSQVSEIFLCSPQENFGSGRVTPATDEQEFTQAVKEIRGAGIRANLVMNSTCEGAQWYSSEVMSATLEYIGYAHDTLGVESITLANPLYITQVRKNFPKLEIHASVLSEIDCVQRALLFKKAGVDVITVDPNINRNLKLLDKIKTETSLRLKLLVNEGCLYKCPFRKFHFNATSHFSREGNSSNIDDSFATFFAAGAGAIQDDLSQLLRSPWIRPENLREYLEITDYFKIAGRAQLNSFIIRATKAYMEEEWNGDLLDLVSGCSKRFSAVYGAYMDNEKLGESKFFETVTSCDNDCKNCGYCQQLAGKLVKLNMFTRAKKDDVLVVE